MPNFLTNKCYFNHAARYWKNPDFELGLYFRIDLGVLFGLCNRAGFVMGGCQFGAKPLQI
jgi:hypothetical protein